MNKMNRKIEYALMSLKFMSRKRPGELTSVKEICSETGCPFDATSRVMQQMTSSGILRSEQGAHGGYQIIKDLSRVSMRDLMETFLGPMAVVKCLKSSICDLEDGCNIKSPVAELNSRMAQFYEELSVLEILSPGNAPDQQAETSTSLEPHA